MTDIAIKPARAQFYSSRQLLNHSAKIWFAVTVLGQVAFVAYIAAFYGGTALEGDFNAWDGRMFNGFISGDMLGNLNIILHIALAFIITASGPIQFIPTIRNRFRTFHRWNGRVYATSAIIISLGALYLTWTRNGIGATVNDVGVTLNAFAIITFATLTARTAIARNFRSHHRWALRLFLAASGVWYMRLGFGLYAFLTGGAMPGSTQMLDGPFDIALSFAITLVPLACLEVFFRSRDSKHSFVHAFMTAGVVVLTLATAIGSVMAAQIFWLSSFS